MNDEIIQLLENSKLRQKVIETIQSVWSYAGTLYDNPDEDMEGYVEKHQGASLWEEAWWRAETCGEVHNIEQAFDEYVIQKMSKPYRLTLEELVEAFLDLTKPDEQHYGEFENFSFDDCNNLYTTFVNYVKNHILSYQHSAPFPICSVIKPRASKELDEKVGEEERPLWDKNGVSVSLLHGADVIDARPAGKKLYQILALIEGNISILACGELQTEMSRILPTAIRSTDLLQTTGFGNGKIIDNIGQGSFLTFQREIEGIPWGDGCLLENAKPLIKQYLDAYYSKPTKKDSIDRRIRNAIYLLVEADNQPNDAIGLALSIAAVEALLGQKGTELTEKLADNVAVLLEPELPHRSEATEFVKKLYDTRSRALHGEVVETERKTRISSRHLAAATLSGVISRRDFLHRLGENPETPDQLLQELRKKRFDSGQPDGIERYNICSLWRKKEAGKKDSSL